MMLPLMFTTIVLSVIFKLFYIYSYWKRRNVAYVCPLRCIGYFTENMFRINSYSLVLKDIYEKFFDKRYVGFFHFFRPVLLIRDPELIRRIMVKDFDCFNLHSEIIPLDSDKLWSLNLVGTNDKEKWVEARTTMSPFFTSNKLKASFQFLEKYAHNLIHHLKAKSNGERITVDMGECLQHLSNNIFATIAFGVSCDSLKEPNNEFYQMACLAMKYSPLRGFLYVCSHISSRLSKILGLTVYNKKAGSFFVDIIKSSAKIRIGNKSYEPDLINTLLELYKRKKCEGDKSLTTILKSIEDDIDYVAVTAQALIIFFAGFETVTGTISLLVYELTVNYDVQQKLYEHIITTLQKFDGKVNYEAIMSMKYLDNVLEETLRLHPPTGIIDRKATKEYVIESEGSGEKELLIEKGTWIWVLQNSIHLDPKYFPNPHKFDPDRFNDDNKHNIQPYTNFPFGIGPKSCIGYRYGILEVKLLIVNLLLNYELLCTTRTKVANSSNTFNVRQHGVWVELNPRSQ